MIHVAHLTKCFPLSGGGVLTAVDDLSFDVGAGIQWFLENTEIDLLVIVSDCQTAWPDDVPPFPVITIRVGDGAPPPWGEYDRNQVITIES